MFTMATISVTVLTIISLLQIKIVYTADGNGGCRPTYGDRISNKMISNKIYGCKGTAGRLSYKCNDGYHWCENAQEVTELGLTPNECIFAEENLYFITREDKICSSYPNNGTTNADEWGCLSESLMEQNNTNLCGPLIEIPPDFVVPHFAIRGVLCCADPPSSGCNSIWSGWENYDKSVITLDELYACSSSNCSQGYHGCVSEDEVKMLGLTVERCMNVAENDAFYATRELTTDNSGKCGIDENDKTLAWGCSSSESSAIHNQCGVLNSAIRLDASGEDMEPIYNKNDLGVFCCTDNPGTGCVYKGIEREVVTDAIYACSSIYSSLVGYEELLDDKIYAQFSCNDGYHICENAREVQILGLTSSTCNSIEDNGMFYGTLEGRVSNKCGTDIIYGCSSNPNVNPSESCGVFNTVIDSTSLYETGGLLCCVDHDAVGSPGIGCADKYLETQVIEDKVYACVGQYNDIEDAETTGCNAFYHVCNSAEELKAKGLTYEKCSNIAIYPDEFYATFEGYQDNNNKCQPSIDGIWGCSSSNSSQINGMCTPLNSVVENDADVDGILCCHDGDWNNIEWEDMPYMVSQRGGMFSGHNCGGSILTLDGHNGNGAILTAAHCISDSYGVIENKDDMSIYIGCTTTTCDSDIDSNKILYSIDKIVKHENYSGTYAGVGEHFAENDIAIIFLTEPIKYTNAIPIIIESDPMIAENNGLVKLTGYSGYAGDGGRGGSDYTKLQYALTNIVPREECKNYRNTILTPADFCVKDDVANDGNMATICNGDSGSPLLYKGKQLGIASFGETGCDPFYPQVATYVPSYLQWIIEKCGTECMVNDGYLGCYKDEENKAALSYEITRKDKNKNKNRNKDKRFTIDKCREKCNEYKYFALQNDGRQCFCENDYELATTYGTSRECGLSKLGGILSNSLFVHPGFKQKQYLPDDALKNGIDLQYGPGKGANGNVVYTVESCRISCSNFKYFSVSQDGECKCGNEYIKSYNEQEYDRHGLFKNVLKDGIEINVNCDNFLNNISFTNDEYNKYVSLPLLSGESYPYDDWTKTQTVMLPNSANCGKVRIVCANAAKDNGPAGVMIGIKYNKQYISSNQQTVENNIIKTINNEGIVLSSQTSTTALSDEPYNAKWIWTCGDDGQWDKCIPGVVNTFEIDLCKLSVANGPKFIDFFIPKDKTVIYWILSIIFVVVNIVLLSICCFKSSSKKYAKVKHVYFDESDVESDEV